MTEPRFETSSGEAPAAMAWIVRIGVTLFVVPFMIIGVGLTLGGGFLGESMGVLGMLIGLPFIAVPGMMLASVWLGRPGPKPRVPGETMVVPPTGQAMAPMAEAPAMPVATNCGYCGRARTPAELTCPGCGAQ